MSAENAYFHFTLGPVQSFVAQARRTRDFWAGSFILSWLSAVAVREVIEQCGNDHDAILFPKPEANFLSWLEGKPEGKEAPQQGSIPNRFKAIVDKQSFKPKLVTKAVEDAWSELAELVYTEDFIGKDLKLLPDKRLWDRQIKGCWEMVWSFSDVPAENDAAVIETPVLDQRKHWRTYIPPNEPGVKCMMMDGWQELSGVQTPKAALLEAFWGPLRASSNTMASDIREKEYLCAIAFVKRRFPRHFEKLNNVEMPSGWSANGWEVEEGRPSVSYMAAAHWWAEVLKHSGHSSRVENCVAEFHQAAIKLTGSLGEWNTSIRCIDEVTSNKKLKALDGDVFFESVLDNVAPYPTETKKRQARDALGKLRALHRETVGIEPASPFYAVLMMDGDSLGIQMKAISKQKSIADALQLFTNEVKGVVKCHNGFLVYAGGDDVLALLPMEDAMACALAVKECYEKVFSNYSDIKATISAAIEYAHIRMPLMKVLKDAHRLLDDIAKDKTGRDALAVRVWKPGGKALEWSKPWSEASDTVTGCSQLVLDRLAKDFANYERDFDPHGQYSNTFFYKIRDRLELFNPPKGVSGSSILSYDEAVKLMAAEYVTSGLCENIDDKTKRLKYAKDRVRPLIAQCKSKAGRYESDAALLLRFLAQKGVGA